MGSKSAWKVVKLDASKKSYQDITLCKRTAGLSAKEYGVRVVQNHAIPTRGMSKKWRGESVERNSGDTIPVFRKRKAIICMVSPDFNPAIT
jgi:hypothetical protein